MVRWPFKAAVLFVAAAVAASGESCVRAVDGGCDSKELDDALLLQLRSKSMEMAMSSVQQYPGYGTSLRALLGTSGADIIKKLMMTFLKRNITIDVPSTPVGQYPDYTFCARAVFELPGPGDLTISFKEPAKINMYLEIPPIDVWFDVTYKKKCVIPAKPSGEAVARANMTLPLAVKNGALQLLPWEHLNVSTKAELPGFKPKWLSKYIADMLVSILKGPIEAAFEDQPTLISDFLKLLPKSVSLWGSTVNTSFTEVATVTKPGAPFGEPALGIGMSLDVTRNGTPCSQPWDQLPWFRKHTHENVSSALNLAVRPLNCFLDGLYADGNLSFTMPVGKSCKYCYRFPSLCLKYGKNANVSLHVYPTAPVQLFLGMSKGIVGRLEYAIAWQVNGHSMGGRETHTTVDFGLDLTVLFKNPATSIGFRVSECKTSFESINFGWLRDLVRDAALNFAGFAGCLLPEKLLQAGAMFLMPLPDVLAVGLQQAQLEVEDGFVAAELTMDLAGDPKECTKFLPGMVAFVNCSYNQAFESGHLRTVIVPSDVPPAASRQLLTGDWCDISKDLCKTYGHHAPMVAKINAVSAPEVSSGADGSVEAQFIFSTGFGIVDGNSFESFFTITSKASIGVLLQNSTFKVTTCDVKKTLDSVWFPKCKAQDWNKKLEFLCWTLAKLLPPLPL